jgi:hypothetical protein
MSLPATVGVEGLPCKVAVTLAESFGRAPQTSSAEKAPILAVVDKQAARNVVQPFAPQHQTRY